MIQELKEDNLQVLVEQNETVFVLYSAGWCGNCRIMKPKFKKLAIEYSNLTFAIVDAEKFPNSRKLANVDNLPTFACFKGGILKDQIQTNKFTVLKEFITSTLS